MDGMRRYFGGPEGPPEEGGSMASTMPGWAPYVGGAAAGLGGLLGVSGLTSRSYDYDPARRALKRYEELINLNSPYWRSMLGFYTKAMRDASPSMDTLFGFNRGSGMTSQGSQAFALRQGEGMSARAREAGSQAMMRQFLSSEDAATRYLGMEYQRGQDEYRGRQGQDDSLMGFANSLLGGGLGLLGSLIPGIGPVAGPVIGASTRRILGG